MFQTSLEQIDDTWRSLTTKSLLKLIYRDRTPVHDAELTDTRNAQPAIGIVSLALAQALEAMNVKPRFLAGHSYGELSALAVAGALDLDVFLRLSLTRGQLLGEAGDLAAGAMAAVMAPRSTVEQLMGAIRGNIVIANLNAPEQFVVSGDVAAIELLEDNAAKIDVKIIRLKTSCAFHSPAMTPVADRFRKVLQTTAVGRFRAARVISNTTAMTYSGNGEEVRALLGRQIVEPVRWVEGIEHLYGLGARIFIEVGPGRALTELTTKILGNRPHLTLALDPGKSNAAAHVADFVAQLKRHGVEVDCETDRDQIHHRLTPTAHGNTLTASGGEPSDWRVPGTADVPSPVPTNELRLREDSMHTRRSTGSLLSVAEAFFDANARMMQEFYAQQCKVVGLVNGADLSQRTALLSSIVQANQRALEDALATNGRAIETLSKVLDASGLERIPAEIPPVSSATFAKPQGQTPRAEAFSPPVVTVDTEFRERIAKVTGLPLEMIQHQSQFERDLGLDSITMTELFFEILRERPELAAKKAELRACQTVGGVIDVLTGCTHQIESEIADRDPTTAEKVPVSTPTSSSESSCRGCETSCPKPMTRNQFAAELARIVQAQLPPDSPTLGEDDQLEDVHHIDVFRRESIAAQLVRAYPALSVAGRELIHAPTLSGLTNLCVRVLDLPNERDKQEPASEAPPEEKTVRWVRAELPCAKVTGAMPDAVLVVGKAERVLAEWTDALQARGTRVTAIDLTAEGFVFPGTDTPVPFGQVQDLTNHLEQFRQGDSLPGLIYLGMDAVNPLASFDFPTWTNQVECAGTGFFALAKALVPSAAKALRPSFIGTVTQEEASPAFAALRGVARVVANEFPDVRVRSVIVAAENKRLDPVAVVHSLAHGPSDHDLVLRPHGLTRMTLRVGDTQISARSGPGLDAESVILLIGGGDGITAEMACKLAQELKCRIAVIGRTPYPHELLYPNAQDELTLKKLILEGLCKTNHGGQVDSALVQERYRLVQRQRALWHTRKRIQAAGAMFVYERADATNASELGPAIERIRNAYGPIRGLVHGAGLTEDAPITSKTIESFRRVLKTKSQSIFLLHSLLRSEPLHFVTLCSSLSAYAGTKGQADYVAANEVLNAVAEQWNRSASYPVEAILWSVWGETGLASPALRRRMGAIGLGCISNDTGQDLFWNEVRAGNKSDAWVMLSPRSTLAYVTSSNGSSNHASEASHAES